MKQRARSDALPDAEPGVGPDAGPDPASGADSAAAGRWQIAVHELWVRVAAERGIDFDPPPRTVAAALPSLVAAVEQHAAGMGEGDRRWLAAGMAALADHVQRTTLPGPAGRPDDAATDGGTR
jgi:hypothetical protein